MKLLYADYILLMDEDFTVLKSGGVVFEKEIIEVSEDREYLKDKFSEAEVIFAPSNSCVMPGLINAHTHLEFSGNRTTLEYGSFLGWLDSVMEHREELVQACEDSCMELALAKMLKSGITSIGAISSLGRDLAVCAKTPQKVVFFNELIGSSPATADVLFADFSQRLENSQYRASPTLIPAIGIHSTYSAHPIVIQKALGLAKSQNLVVSAHFMESKSERRWIDDGKGEFQAFFKSYFNTETPVSDAKRFLDSFKGVQTVFTHCVHATDEEKQAIQAMGATIAHCPVSNRLLGVGKLDLESLKNLELPFAIATDGLSSNISLSLFDELRVALMMHYDLDLRLLAKDLLKGVTKVPAQALGLNSGEIQKGKDADLIVFTLPEQLHSIESLAYHIILHTQEVETVFINGEKSRWNF